MLERIKEINDTLAVRQAELAEANAERITEIETEVTTLMEERSKLTEDMKERANKAFENGTVVELREQVSKNKKKGIVEMEYTKRDKLNLITGKKIRNKEFTDMEIRKLGTALTTTADTYVAATSTIDGVNNAGIFIPTIAILDVLKEEGKLSPIIADIAMTNIKGLVDFPYRKSRDASKAKKEGAAGTDKQMEWSKLTGTKGYLQTIIAVTDEVQALSDIDFGAYIIDQILQDIDEDWALDLIYANGTNDRVKGLVTGAKAAVSGGYEEAKLSEAIIAGIKACKGKFRKGAKLYVAQDVADSLSFEKDANGNYKYPVYNNNRGITSFGTLQVAVDENLKDGDFVIANVAKYFKVNTLIPIRLEQERVPRKGLTEYVASEFCSTAVMPDAVIYGNKK